MGVLTGGSLISAIGLAEPTLVAPLTVPLPLQSPLLSIVIDRLQVLMREPGEEPHSVQGLVV
jgi:hypothetical protein